jgi:hypothetical protein
MTAAHGTDGPTHDGTLAQNTSDGHGDDHGQDGHAHDDSMPLGPIDVIAWGAGILGVVLGSAVVWAFVLATAEIAVAA